MKKWFRLLLVLTLTISIVGCMQQDNDAPVVPLTVCQKAEKMISEGKIDEAYALLLQSGEKDAGKMLENFAFIPLSVCFNNKKFEYTYDENGRPVKIMKYRDGEVYGKEEFVYYPTGELHGHTAEEDDERTHQNYLPNGKLYMEQWVKNGVITTYEYTYNDAGQMVSKRITGGNPTYASVYYSYDDRGNCISTYSLEEYNYYNRSAFTRRKFNENNQLIAEEITSDDSVTKKLYSYHTNGKKTREETYVDEELRLVLKYEYNDMGQLIMESTMHTGNQSENDRTYYYEYDSAGNKLTKRIVYQKGTELFYEYKYDDKGNLLEERITGQDGYWKKEEYTYDQFGRLLTYKKSGEYEADSGFRYLYVTDDTGRIQDIISFDTLDRMDDHYEYSYDAYGYLTRYTKCYRDGRMQADLKAQWALRYYPNGVHPTVIDTTDDIKLEIRVFVHYPPPVHSTLQGSK